MNCYTRNLDCLKKHYPHIAREVLDIDSSSHDLMIETAKNGQKTILVSREKRFYLHSKYNPGDEAQRFARENITLDCPIYLLYGFGLGYHVKACVDLMAKDSTLVVFENNMSVFLNAMENQDLCELIEADNLELIITGTKDALLNQLKDYISTKVNKKLILHMPSVQAISSENGDMKFMLENWNLVKSISDEYIELLDKNHRYNSQNIQRVINPLFGRFKDIPAIIIGAGPSLDIDKNYLKNIEDKALIFSSGTALKPLINCGVMPHLFMVIDPDESTFRQIEGIEDVDIPAVFLSTASSYTVSNFRGNRIIAFNKEYSKNERPEVEKISSGGSVATAIMDICIRMGCNPIALVGVDLAYSNNKHHADHTEHGEDNKIRALKNMRTVYNSKGEQLYTTLGFLSFKRWIENRIQDNRHIEFINCSQGGAKIEGTKELPLEKLKEKYLKQNYNLRSHISEILNL